MSINVQDVFTKVMNAGIYSEGQQELMCHALQQAAYDGVITEAEWCAARGEINGYLRGFGSLGGFLDKNGHPFYFTDRLAIYLDWANKPTFKK
jgi:hypothetical protein